MIGLTCFVWYLNMVNSAMILVYGFSLLSSFSSIKSNQVFIILSQPVQWSVNFITILALLYLFHYQGRKRCAQPQKSLSIYEELRRSVKVENIATLDKTDSLDYVDTQAREVPNDNTNRFMNFIEETVTQRSHS